LAHCPSSFVYSVFCIGLIKVVIRFYGGYWKMKWPINQKGNVFAKIKEKALKVKKGEDKE
jgi:hypothetical protein